MGRQKTTIKTALSIVFLAAFFLAVSAAADDRVVVDYSFSVPQIQKITVGDNTYSRIIMPDAPNGGQIGEPSLPAYGTRILIPAGEEVSEIEIINGEPIGLGRGLLVEPVAKPFRLSESQWSEDFLPKPDERIYNSDMVFPGVSYEKIGTQNFRGYSILVLNLRPVEYIPLSGELYYYENFRIIVNTVASDRSHTLYRGSAKDEIAVSNMVDNSLPLKSYASLSGSSGGSRDEYDLLIITTTALEASFQPLKDYHDNEGILTEIVTTDDIGSNEPDAVRAYITDAYLNDGIEYVIIGGDDNFIISQDMFVQSWPDEYYPYYEYDMPSDIYFACLDGTFNYDGDDRWGEPTDGEGGGDVDLIAEIYIGRFSIGTETEADNIINKTLQYLDTQDGYLNDILLAGEELGFGGYGEFGCYSLEELVDGSDANGYTTVGFPSGLYNIDKLYDRDWAGYDWPSSEMVSRINSDLHIINHYGHCNESWALKQNIYAVTNSLTNTNHSFIYSQGCLAGHFDEVDCWAENVTGFTPYGAFAVIMNARYGFGDSGTDGASHRFNREFWDAVYNPDENKARLGEANQDSKEDNLHRVNDPCMRWCYYQLHLFGDPTVTLKRRSGIAFEYPEGVPTFVTANEPTVFEMDVYGVYGGTPVTGSGQLHYSIGGGDEQVLALTETAANQYEVTLPEVECESSLEFYLSAEEETLGRIINPGTGEHHTVIPIESIDVFYEENFETDNGWTVSGGLWGRGIPTGGGGEFGWPDPTEGCNGPNVIGYNLSGDYENDMPGEFYITSPAIDCSGKYMVYLNFWRWLGVEGPAADHAAIYAGNNGTDWQLVWENMGEIRDSFWTEVNIDISTLAADQPTFYLRFSMGSTDAGWRFCGWNVDDISLINYICVPDLCGDTDGDEAINILDVVFLINYIYKSGAAPDPVNIANVNHDEDINILDVVYLINYIYKGGPEPECP